MKKEISRKPSHEMSSDRRHSGNMKPKFNVVFGSKSSIKDVSSFKSPRKNACKVYDGGRVIISVRNYKERHVFLSHWAPIALF